MKEKFVILFVSRISSNIFGIISGYVLVSSLGASLLGNWLFLLSLINIGYLFIDLGFDKVHLQYSGNEKGREYFSTYFFIKCILIFSNTVFVLFLIGSLNLWESSIFILLISNIFFLMTKVFIINLKSKIKVFKVEVPYFLTNFGRNILILMIAFNVDKILDPILILSITYLVFNVIFIGLILIFSLKELNISKPNKKHLKAYLNDVKPLIYYSIIFIIASNLGNLIIAYYFGEESLGYYGLVNNYIISLLLLISSIFIDLCIVIFAQYIENNDLKSLKNLTYALEKYLSIFFLGVILIVYISSDLIFNLFLPEYTSAVPILYIMIFIPYLKGITRPYSIPLISAKKFSLTAKINSINNVFIIVLMIILVPPSFLIIRTLGLGILGCAIAQTIPWILWSIIMRYFFIKQFNIDFQKSTFLHLPITAITIVISLFIRNLIIIVYFDEFLHIFFTLLISFIIYFGLLIIFKNLTKNDLKLLLQILNLNRYRTSLEEEFRN